MSGGWRKSTLGERCQIKPPKKEARNRLAGNDMVSFVPMNNLGLREKGFEAAEDRALQSVSGSYTYFADGDVLLAKITPCFENGKLGIARGLTNGVGFGSSEFIVFRPKEGLDAEYLFYFLSQDSFRDAGAKVMSGAVGHKRVPKDFINGLQLLLPLLPEQKRIVAILDEAFAGIDTAIANTEKNLANARELFESYLNAVFTEHSSGWIIKSLGECFRLRSGDGLTSKNMIPGKYSVFGGNGIAGTHYSYNLTGDNVVIGRVGALCGNARHIKKTIWLTDNAFKVVEKEFSLDNAFLTYLLNFKNLRAYARQSAQPVVSNSSLKNIRLAFPEPEISQSYIVEQLDGLRAETEQLEEIYQQKLTALAELKQTLLQKAFSGELTADQPVFSDSLKDQEVE